MRAPTLSAILSLVAVLGCEPSTRYVAGLPWGEPAGPTRGGRGLAGAGGDAGRIWLSTYGDIRVKASPSVDPAPVPRVPALDLGTNPRTISVDATLSGDNPLGDDGATVATGLWVKGGATLTVDRGWLTVAGPILIDGTVTSPYDADFSARVSIDLTGVAIVVGSTGVVDVSAGPEGGPGSVGLWTPYVDGAVVVQGSITARGRDGASPTAGGAVELSSSGEVVVDGVLDARGGSAAGGEGGAGGTVVLGGSGPAASEFPTRVHVTGEIHLRGGDGPSAGGTGGWLEAWALDASVLTGIIDAAGGDSTSLAGGGGTIHVAAVRSWIVGRIGAPGGIGKGSGLGGAGGQLLVYGGGYLSGSIDLTGGEGAVGAAGGFLMVEAGDPVAMLPIVLAGFDPLASDGGDGIAGGGAGGTFEVNGNAVDLEVSLSASAGSALENRPGGVGGTVQIHGTSLTCRSIVSNGGDAAASSGGLGGAVTLTSAAGTVIDGTVTVRGGRGRPDGRYGWVTVDDVVRTVHDDGVYTP